MFQTAIKPISSSDIDILGDDSMSFWIKRAVVELDQRDICDVLTDLAILTARFELILQEATGS